jgi:uncharacterized protein with PIN domain
MHVRVCVECGEEYRPEIAVCADCGGALEDRHGDASVPPTGAAPPGETAVDAAPDSDFTHSVFHADKATELTAEADRLVAAGIPFRIRPARGAGYRLLVADADSDRALAALGLLAEHSGIPDDVRRCPSCETPVVPGTAECPECGLAVGDEPDPLTCERCGRSLDGPQCPDCGR